MFKDPKIRFTVIVFLIIILVSMFIWFGSLGPEPSNGAYPGKEELFEDYDDHVGEKVEVTGDVVDTDPLTIKIERLDEEMKLQVTGTDIQSEGGDKLQVFGVLHEDHSIRAENAVRLPLGNYIYMYAVSIVAAIWISIRIITRWRWDGKEHRIEERDEPLSIRQLLGGSGG